MITGRSRKGISRWPSSLGGWCWCSLPGDAMTSSLPILISLHSKGKTELVWRPELTEDKFASVNVDNLMDVHQFPQTACIVYRRLSLFFWRCSDMGLYRSVCKHEWEINTRLQSSWCVYENSDLSYKCFGFMGFIIGLVYSNSGHHSNEAAGLNANQTKVPESSRLTDWSVFPWVDRHSAWLEWEPAV